MNLITTVGIASDRRVAERTAICNPTTGNSVDFEALLKWIDLQNRPISDVITNEYQCSAYNLLTNGRLEILANANRRGLRILNASGNASGFNRCDVLVGTKYQPTVTRFNRAISFDDDKILDGPTLQQFASCVPISGQPLDGYFVVVELF
jgi:hypothetical protein